MRRAVLVLAALVAADDGARGDRAAAASAGPRRIVNVVPHTHWDREWYRTFEAYRFRLVRTIDDVLAADLPYFLLDGQTITLQDYLAIRPEQEPRLRRQIARGRLGIGPWYVLADEFLVSGEALVRNLQAGRADMRRFGAELAVGYLPDNFGHVAQMPQVLAGFGIRSAVVWRGVDPSFPRFRWRGPDGSEVATSWLPDGYYQPMFLGDGPASTSARRLERHVEAHAGSGPVLFMSGADHMAPRADLERRLGAVNAESRLVAARITSLDAAIAGPPGAGVVHGELRDNARAYLLPGVLSTRMRLKQANAACQTSLERYAEPLAALAWIRGAGYPAAFLDHAWRRLLENHPHDSICGTSIDEVHAEMVTRFGAVGQVAEALTDAAVGASADQSAPRLFAFNPASTPFAGWVETAVDWPLAGAPREVAVEGLDGTPLPTIGLGHEDTTAFRAEIDREPDRVPVRRFRLATRLDVAGVAGRSLRLRPGRPAPVVTDLVVSPTSIGNAHLALLAEGGRLDLVDRATGRVYVDCHRFVDEGDAGDAYNFSPLAGDRPIRSELLATRVVANGPHRAVLEATFRLRAPSAIDPERGRRGASLVELRLTSRFTLDAGSRVLAVDTELDNRARDHRLRVVLGAGPGARPAVWSESAFGVFERRLRPMGALPAARGTEAVAPEFPQGGFTALARGASGLAVASVGLPEAALVGGPEGWGLAVTLLRSVGWLSRDDLRTRGGAAGPAFATPGAQCQGPARFRYGLIPFSGGWPTALGSAQQLGAPVRLWAAAGIPGVERTISLGAPGLVVSAMKRSADGRHLVVRAYNATPAEIRSSVVLALPHRRVFEGSVDEQVASPTPVDLRAMRWRPYAIKTWLIEP